MPFEAINYEIVERAFVVSGVGKQYGLFAGTVDSSEFFNNFARGDSIFGIVGQGEFYKRDTFFRYNNMSVVSLKEDEVIFFTGGGLIRVIPESGRGIMFCFRVFVVSIIRIGSLKLFSWVSAITGLESMMRIFLEITFLSNKSLIV